MWACLCPFISNQNSTNRISKSVSCTQLEVLLSRQFRGRPHPVSVSMHASALSTAVCLYAHGCGADLKTPRAPKIQLKWTKIKYTTFDKELSHFILIKIMIHSCQAQKYLMPKTTNICQLTIKINLPLSHGQIQENRISFLIFSPRLQLKLTFASTQQMEK